MQLKAIFTILRPLNCLMAAFGTFIGYCISAGSLNAPFTGLFAEVCGFTGECFYVLPAVWIAMAVAFLVCGGGMAVNDYFDLAVDKKLHPKKPLPSGRVPPKAALYYATALFLGGNLIAFYCLPAAAFAIALAFTILLVLYSMLLSKAKYLGNWVVASGTAFTLVFGASLIGNYAVVAWLAVAALFANLARELIKDLEDIKADTGYKKSLPMLLGAKKVNAIIFLYYLAAIIAVYVPALLLGFSSIVFVSIVSIANILFLYSFALAEGKKFARAQFFSKIAMLIALAGFLFGVA